MTQSSQDAAPARAQVQAVRAEIDAARAQIEAARAQGQAARAQGGGSNADAILAGPLPPGWGRVIVDEQGDRTVFTSTALPPELMPLAGMVKNTALGLMGLLAAIVILGPFARMFARRMERRPELKAAENQAQALQQQLQQLQQSMDVMALEVERISEAQRFQSKLLSERKSASVV